MRSPATLVVLKPTTKYAALQEAELKLVAPGAARLAGQLWRLPPALAEGSVEPLVGLQQLLRPLVRAPSFDLLLAELALLVALFLRRLLTRGVTPV